MTEILLIKFFSYIVVPIVFLGVLIFIHELGHYLAARHVGVRVEAFSIGFPPTAWGKQVGDTEYRLSWVPIGGYVKLFGQNVNDENPDDQTNYAAKSIFQRFYILAAGPAMNLLFALIFMPLVFLIGMDMPAYLNEPPLIQNVQQGSYAQEIGIHANDEILAVNGAFVKNWEELDSELAKVSSEENLTMEVDRAGSSVILEGSGTAFPNAGQMGLSPFIAPVVGEFTEQSPAMKAGIQTGDKVKRINGLPINDWSEISPAVQQFMGESVNNSKTATKTLTVELERNGDIQFVEVAPYFEPKSQRWLLGIPISMPMIFRSYTFGDSVILGTSKLWSITKSIFIFLGKMFQGEGSMDELGGPVKIFEVIGDTVQILSIDKLFFLFSLISLQLCILNLLPIPALDGGHIFMLLIEKFKGSPLSVSMREKTQMVGFSLLVSLMVFVTWNDLMRFFIRWI